MKQIVDNKPSMDGEEEPKRRSLWADVFFRLVKEKPLGVIGGVIVLVMLLSGILADVITPYDMAEIHKKDLLEPPSAQYLLGTDALGRDMLSRIIYGARTSMIVGLGASGLAVVVATIIGLISGYYGGKTDLVTQRFVDAIMSFPALFLYLTIMSVFGRGILQLILVLGIIRGIRNSRVVRGAVIGIKENVYVDAARAIGAPTGRILVQHILPNIIAPVIIIFTISLGQMILSEATLSFLGFGIPPPWPSWGGMLSSEARRFMYVAPWLAIWPGLALAVAVWGINMLGDGLRDILDPRLRGGTGRYGRRVLRKGRSSESGKSK